MAARSTSGRHVDEAWPAPAGGERNGSHGPELIRETVPAGPSGRRAAQPGPASEIVSASSPRRFGAAVRILFGVVWLADAFFKWQPSFLHGLPDVMRDGSAGQPSWLDPWFTFTRAVIGLQPTLWAYGIAIAETVLALALLCGFARKVTYVAGAAWSLLIWTTAEGFGHVPSGVATDIGTAIVYAVVFLALLASDQCAGTRPFSLDAVIERRVAGWQRVAEPRR